MEKWILWGLLEASTVMVVAALWLLWRAYALRNKQQSGDTSAQTETATTDETVSNDDTSINNDGPSYKLFAKKLEQQANTAADQLVALRTSDDIDTVTQYKIWGTLAKAERAIILNDTSDHPQSILNRFMASIINTLQTIQSKRIDKRKLQSNLKDLDEEFIQASELLISKEELIKNQQALHEELKLSIDHTTKRITKMGVKATELQHLTMELKKLQDQVKQLEGHTKHSDQYKEPVSSRPTHETEHHSSSHLKQLERLSQRQQAIIEHLQAELKDSKGGSKEDKEQVRLQALQRMDRLAQESSSLIDQLQAELNSANLSIESLRNEVSAKDQQIQALDEKLKSAESNVMTEYQSLNSTKQLALEEILGDIENWSENNTSSSVLDDQTKEIGKLEQMLRESETCVQLLVQELETAEMDNNTLRKQIEQARRTQTENNTSDQAQPLAQLQALRDTNRSLVQQVHELKEQVVDNVSGTSEKALRNEYNKKSLELDRLQLAYSDLERKYLGTLRE